MLDHPGDERVELRALGVVLRETAQQIKNQLLLDILPVRCGESRFSYQLPRLEPDEPGGIRIDAIVGVVDTH